MYLEGTEQFHRRAAALLRAVANDLKRDDASAEADLDLPVGSFAELTGGRRPITWEIVRRACEVWPLNERDLLPGHDDCDAGIRVVRAGESVRSARIIDRAGKPYYEYRDTAMSRVASYRPEWIRMLCHVTDNSPENPEVRWNNGHLLYQFTYFVGPVNYYYRWNGESRCTPMNTGDSVWGLPFAPHSFTARSSDEPAYILALTYGANLVGDAQRELSILGPGATKDMVLPLGSTGSLLTSFMDARMLTSAQLAHASGIAHSRLRSVCADETTAMPDELTALANVLGVAVRELLAPEETTHFGVHIQKRTDTTSWDYHGAYHVTRLAGDSLHPHTTAVEVDVHTEEPAWAATYQHQYLYVLGERSVRLHWEHGGRKHETVLAAGDSAYLMPYVRCGFSGEATVLVLRIGGMAGTDVRFALGAMADGGIDRYLDEDRLWFDAGKTGGQTAGQTGGGR
nr:helix-turn-helix domain-containing protein [Kibdelosporangium sp. MJ126-NF4]CEL18019.1 hypothetical protein [Kibdelosporangium sp. MJ126-NF4]CTQ90753.1 hypothetical protein [Kibdelosporangium sp. MJ126-NF4]